MALTPSTMLPLGTPLPAFELELVKGTIFEIDASQSGVDKINNKDFSNQPLLIMVICAHCPFVKHIEAGITRLEADFASFVNILAISSNSLLTHPQDAPKELAIQANKYGWKFPYLFDSEQIFAKALRAACTPDFFLFSPSSNGQQILQYRGQFDGSRPGNKSPVTGMDLRAALEAVLNDQMVCQDQNPSIGCNIKWNPGNEPAWFGSAVQG